MIKESGNLELKARKVHAHIDVSGSPLEFPGAYVCGPCVRRNARVVLCMCNLAGHSSVFVIFCLWCFVEASPSIGKVRVKHMGTLVTLKGTVIRSGGVKMIEYEREYMCRKCRHRFVMHISGML
jgi:DNA replicative helicase MCM subunit Mcm2 (Cdc46/Mcm family)